MQRLSRGSRFVRGCDSIGMLRSGGSVATVPMSACLLQRSIQPGQTLRCHAGNDCLHRRRDLRRLHTSGSEILPEQREDLGEIPRPRLGIFFETGGDQFFPRRRHRGRHSRGGTHLGDCLGNRLADLRQDVVPCKCRRAAEQRVHEHAKPVDVVAGIRTITVNLLRAQVGQMRRIALGKSGALERIQNHSADSEIRDQQPAIRPETDVFRRQVAVKKLDAMRVRERLGKLRDPRLQVRRVQRAFPLQHVLKRLAVELIHRNRHVASVLHEIIHPKNVRVDELAVPFHLLAQLRHRTRIGSHRGRHKVKRHILAEHLIAREPHGPCIRLAQIAAEHIAAADFRSLAEDRFGTVGCGRQFVG